jgi:AraC-like DNA-binding protein
MLLLDTAGIPPEERVDAFRAAMGQASVPCRIEHPDAVADIWARMHLWVYGRATLFTADASEFRLARTPKHVHMESPPVVAIAVQARSVGRFSQFDRDQLVGPGDLMLNDLTAPYSFAWSGDGAARAFRIPYDQLGLPVDVVRKAGGRLAASPLHDLVNHHLRRLSREAQALSDDAGAAALGTATTELVRALVTSAADDERFSRPVMAETLVTRVQTYVGLHLSEPGLTPHLIARMHNVSLRQLYKSFARAGLSLEQWIIDQRLEAARSELSSPAGRRRPIAATARTWGFQDPSHFSRRFRDAYDMTPRDWQQLAGEGIA